MDRKEKAKLYAREYRSKNTTTETRAAAAKANRINYYKRKAANPIRIKAQTHHNLMRQKWPEACENTDIDTDGLALWMEVSLEKSCPFCGNKVEQIDHIIPFARGGLHMYDNIRMVCGPCNRAKSDMTDEEYKNWMRNLIRFQTIY